MSNEIVTLNLRGTKFEVPKKTFEKMNFDKVQHWKTAENEYFISRDPTNFHLVLDIVETGVWPTEDQVTSALKKDVSLFGPNLPMMNSDFVTLDLRGTKFKVYKKSFEKMNLGRIQHSKTGEDQYFINRDPKLFHVLLDRMDYQMMPLHRNVDFSQEVNRELSIYGICPCVKQRSVMPFCAVHGHYETYFKDRRSIFHQ